MTPANISVVVPTRDRPALLERALSGAVAQRGVEPDIVVVDDGSASPVAIAHPWVRVIRLETSRGVAHARNRGIAAAKAAWIAFLDDDDFWAPDRLAKLLKVARNTGADAVVNGSIVLLEDGQLNNVNQLPDGPRAREDLRTMNVLGSPSGVMVASGLLERVGGFDETFSVLADWELWLRLADAGTFAVCPEILTGYVVHHSSMHVQHTTVAMAEFKRLVDRYGDARRVGDGGIDDEEFMRWAAGVHRRAGRRWTATRIYLRNGLRHRRSADLARALLVALGEDLLRKADPRPPRPPPQPPDWLSLYVGADGIHPLSESAVATAADRSADVAGRLSSSPRRR